MNPKITARLSWEKSSGAGVKNRARFMSTVMATRENSPMNTAFWACFLPCISERISVTKKEEAYTMLPSVAVVPNSSTSLTTWMLATMAARGVQA